MSPTEPDNRRGRLLVAAPALVDPNFHRAVVLILEHSPDGALGLVLNRPTPLVSREALPAHLAELMPHDERVFEGGPVQPEAVILLADFADAADAATLAFGTVGIVDPEAAAGRPDGLRSVRAFGGYAGWAGGQLEQEVKEEAWLDAAPETDDVFTDDHDGLWGRVLERKGGSWRLIARMPEDPRLN